MKYQAYPEYKEPEIKWIDSMPSDWVISRIKFFSQLNPSKQEVRDLPSEIEVTFLPMESIGEKGGLDVSASKSIVDLINGYTYVGENDVLIAKITPCFENGKGAIASGLKNGVAFATTEVIPLRVVNKCTNKFLYYLLSCDPFRKIAEGSMYGAGGQKRVSDGFVANYHFAKPSDKECVQISNSLDHETAKIDTLIDKQQQLIKLLKEKRQAVISHAVTKGLNPDAPMKDSGVEWLGEVPEHWDITYLNHIVEPQRKIMYGIVLPGPNVDVGVPIVKGGDVKPGRLTVDSLCKTTFEIESNYERSRLREGDLVYSIRGTIGDVQIVPKEIDGANLTQDAARIAPRVGILNTWLFYVMESSPIFSQLEIGSLGAAVRGINIRDLKKACIPLPPESERNQIAEHLDKLLSRLDQLENMALEQVALLKERRTALISAAVTGKIDVRNWKPEQAESRMEATA